MRHAPADCCRYQFGLFAQYGYAGRAGCGYAGNPGSGSGSATLSAHQTQSLFIPGLITIANQHDARGNMTSADSLRFYAYNALNQATEVRRVASVGSSDITIRARFAYGVDGAYRAAITERDGMVVLDDGRLDGPLSYVVPDGELEQAINRELAGALTAAGYRVAGVTLGDGALTLALTSGS